LVLLRKFVFTCKRYYMCMETVSFNRLYDSVSVFI
jgi:hypothetical protein